MKKKKLSVIGKPLRKVDAMAKCAGDTVYADDLDLPRMIHAKLLRSPHPHARILSINAARALQLEGVFAVITGEEMPEKFGIMPSTQDEEALAIDKVRFVGDPVAGVAATTESLAEKALGHIDVEYEVLKPILSIEEALASTEESERIHTWNRRANIQKAVSLEFAAVEGGFSLEPALDSGQELVHVEGLADVVDGSPIETLRRRGPVVDPGEHQHRCFDSVFAQLFDDVEPEQSGHQLIEDDEVEFAVPGHRVGSRAVACGLDVVSGATESGAKQCLDGL